MDLHHVVVDVLERFFTEEVTTLAVLRDTFMFRGDLMRAPELAPLDDLGAEAVELPDVFLVGAETIIEIGDHGRQAREPRVPRRGQGQRRRATFELADSLRNTLDVDRFPRQNLREEV